MRYPALMHNLRIDHIVLTVSDIAASVDFYVNALGMTAVFFAGGRTALAFGDQKINLHEAGREITPHAARAGTGFGRPVPFDRHAAGCGGGAAGAP